MSNQLVKFISLHNSIDYLTLKNITIKNL